MNIKLELDSDDLMKGLSNLEKSELLDNIWNNLSISSRCYFIKKHLNLLAYSDLKEEMSKRGY